MMKKEKRKKKNHMEIRHEIIDNNNGHLRQFPLQHVHMDIWRHNMFLRLCLFVHQSNSVYMDKTESHVSVHLIGASLKLPLVVFCSDLIAIRVVVQRLDIHHISFEAVYQKVASRYVHLTNDLKKLILCSREKKKKRTSWLFRITICCVFMNPTQNVFSTPCGFE